MHLSGSYGFGIAKRTDNERRLGIVYPQAHGATRTMLTKRDWLAAGLLWTGLALLATLPQGSLSWLRTAGRIVFLVTLCAHLTEAVYCAAAAHRRELGAVRWFGRGAILGYLAVLSLQRDRFPERAERP